MASVIVDDTDLSQLAYTAHSDWVREGSPPEYDSCVFCLYAVYVSCMTPSKNHTRHWSSGCDGDLHV